MSNAPTLSTLQAMSDEDIGAAYDGLAKTTTIGTGFYLDELNRRAQVRAMESAHRLARYTFALSVVSVLVALLAVLVAGK